jgi:hypothetical protein
MNDGIVGGEMHNKQTMNIAWRSATASFAVVLALLLLNDPNVGFGIGGTVVWVCATALASWLMRRFLVSYWKRRGWLEN